MGTTTESNATGNRPGADTDRYSALLDQPTVAVIVGTIALGGGVGLLVVAYITTLHQLRVAPRQDAVIVAGVLSVLVVAAGVLVTQLRIGRSLTRAVGVLERSTDRHEAEIATLQAQTEQLERATVGLQKQQQTQHGLFTPALEIDAVSPIETSGETDTLLFTVSNRSFGPALDCSIRSELSLIDPPTEYPLSGESADCPTVRQDTTGGAVRVEPYADGATLAVDGRVAIVDSSTDDEQPLTCGYTTAARVCGDDGVDAMKLTFELSYEDVFGSTYTERVQLPPIELTGEPPIADCSPSPTTPTTANQ